MKTRKAFTLVEIMIVVAIIGLLAAIAIPSFMKARTTSQKNACINNLRVIDAAKEQCAVEGGLPEGDAVDQADIEPYMKAYPSCPAGGAYTIGVIGADPTCDVAGHVLP
jgi:prepilin-type N-terminal cleavage/methylation domain-containing protein